MPLTALQHSADQMARAPRRPAPDAPRTVQIAAPSIVARASLGTIAAIPVTLAVVFLTYFLLANGSLFRRKFAGLLPGAG